MIARKFVRRRIVCGAVASAVLIALAHADWPADLNGLEEHAVPQAGASDNAEPSFVVAPAQAETNVGQWGQPVDWTYGDPESFHDLALWAGWTEAEWPKLRAIIWRESRAQPDAYNGRGRDRSYGLAQLNDRGGQLWRPMRTGWDSLAAECGLWANEALLDPAVNLLCAERLHAAWGWSPWQ